MLAVNTKIVAFLKSSPTRGKAFMLLRKLKLRPC